MCTEAQPLSASARSADMSSMGKKAYLPVLHGKGLWFLPFDANTPLVCNKYGIPEPALSSDSRCIPQALDLVLTPLVAFDGMGRRLGMGGGYYDRTFAYLLRRRVFVKPMLVGVAYAFQQVATPLPKNPWDVPLDGVVTDNGWLWPRFSRISRVDRRDVARKGIACRKRNPYNSPVVHGSLCPDS
uniref:5-formyltetrahydrofolate cyclo-ligase n=1 Tax=Candidatus Kentrum sp. LPFa TaxID=2126335 RepID=A0A450WTF5_9GAMM|nr:MAG: 5,10-methenyltetrahydrofolate synthetase [Candidatus Kentron sp. LPFa]